MIGEHFPKVSPPSRQSLKSYNANFVMDKCARNKYGATLTAKNPSVPKTGRRRFVSKFLHIGDRFVLSMLRNKIQKAATNVAHGLSMVKNSEFT